LDAVAATGRLLWEGTPSRRLAVTPMCHVMTS